MFAMTDGELGSAVIFGILILSSAVQIWLAMFRPESYKAMLEDQKHKRERRDKMLGTGLGWLFGKRR